MLTKGAMGNLINRYRAVLKKCNLINVFGSLAVASMFVMGAGVTADAQEYTTSITGYESQYNGIKTGSAGNYTYTFSKDDTLKTNDEWAAINLSNQSATIKNIDSITNMVSKKEGYAVYSYGNKQTLVLEDVNLTSVNDNSSGIAVANGIAVFGGANSVTVGNGDIKASAGTVVSTENDDARAIANGIDVEHGSTLNMGTGNIFVEATSSGTEDHSVLGRGFFVYGFDANDDFVETGVSKTAGNIRVTARAGEGAYSSDAYGIESWGKGNSSIGEGDIIAEAEGPVDAGARAVSLNEDSTLFKGDGNIVARATVAEGSAQASGVQAMDDTRAELGKVNITAEALGNTGEDGYHYAYGLEAGGNAKITMAGGTIKVRAPQGDVTGIELMSDTEDISIRAGVTADLSIDVEGKTAVAVYTNDGNMILGAPNTQVDITARGDDRAVGISFQGTKGVVTLNGNTTVDADVALEVFGKKNTGSLINTGNFTVKNGTVATFTGDYTQQKGATFLPGTDFFGGNVTLEKGSLTVGHVDASTAGGADSVLALGKSITVAEGKNLLIGTETGTGVVFGPGSALVVDGKAASEQAMIKGSGTLTVEEGSQLYIADAQANTAYTITDGMSADSYWNEANLLANRLIKAEVSQNGDAVVVETEVKDVASALPGVIPAAGLKDMLEQNLNDTDSSFMGIRFLSRAVEPLYMSDDAKAVAAVNEVSRAAVTAGVQNTSLRLSDAASDTVLNHLSLGSFDSGNRIHQDGVDMWAAPMYGNTYSHGMGVSGASVRGNYGGIAFGADTQVGEIAGGSVRVGAALNGGGGKSETSGTATDTENSYNFGGVNLYAGWNLDSLNVMASLGYGMGSHDVKMNLPASLGMGQAEADVDTGVFTADLRAEYQIKTGWLDILPHAGVRYTALHTDSHDLKVNGSTLNSVKSDTQNIVQFPIGVTVTKNIDAAGWNVKPQADVSVIPAAGEKKAFTRVGYSGLDAWDSVNTRIMDSTSFGGMLGVQAEKGNLALGLNYGVQASRHETDQKVQLNIGWKF